MLRTIEAVVDLDGLGESDVAITCDVDLGNGSAILVGLVGADRKTIPIESLTNRDVDRLEQQVYDEACEAYDEGDHEEARRG
jgi:hypothetical protein